MANNSPTIVAASLSDDQLKKSIESLVTHVDEAMKKMVQSTNNAVGEMEAKLKSLGNIKIDSGGSADGGASKRAKAQNEETAAIKESTKAYKDKKMTLDQMASSQQVAIRSANPSGIRNADTLQTMNIQLDLLRERLREARQQYSSFVALAAHATTTGDKGLFQYATDGVHRYEQEVRSLIPQIRGLQDGIQQIGNVLAPQGHTIQNYVNSLQKANPELAQLNEQFKRGKSLLQQQKTEFEQNAQAQRSSTNATNQQKQTLDDMNAYIRQNIQREQERRDAIRQTGLAARETADQLIRSAHEQASAQGNSPITGIKELTVAVEQMRRAYFDMSASEKASPIGLALEADIKRANDAIAVIKKYNQSLLGAEQRNGNNITNTSTLSSLRESLKNLTEQYNRLTVAELNAGKGDALIQHFQDTTRAAQILQRTLNRPVSLKAALAGDERTLDDIAYKMQRLRAYKQGIDLTKPNAANEIKQVDEALVRLQKDADKWMSKSQEMIKNNTALGRSWNYMKNRLAFYFTVGASTQFIKNLIEVRSQYEMNERALGILVNSAERGTQIFNELSQMALVSPYTLIELSAAAKQLTAYDVAAKDVVDTTRRLADMAAAVGIPIERLTYSLGQIKAYGYLNARDARMFANAGIPLVKQLSEYYTELEGRLVSTADIYDRIKKKSIGYEEVTSVIAKMTDEGGKFYDFQAKMAETLKVQLANLTLAWNNMLNAMGEESQGVLVAGISTLKQVFLHWKDIEHVLYELVVALGAYKAYQIITTRLMGATAASLDAQVLAMKRNKAAMLEKQALTRKLTVDELRQVAAQNELTMSDYKNALSGKNLTKQKALLLIALNRNNFALKSAIINMGLLTATEANNITTGRALAIVFKSIGISIRNAALAVKAFMASMWPLLVIGAIYELYHAWDSYGEHVKEVNKQAAEHAKEAFENIKQYLESDVTSALQDKLAKGGKVESDAAGQKAWDEMREKIELSSSASNAFIAKLMQINDINERLSTGFGYLEDIQRVAGVMQTLEEDAVNVSSTVLGGLFGEGLKDDLADFINAYQKYVSLNENLRQGGVGEEYFNKQKSALEEFRGEVEKTTTSLYNIASKEGFNTTEQREFFEREISEIAQAEQMGAKETRIFRMQAEKEYYAYAREQLVAQLEYQQGAQKAATEKRIKDLDNEFGTNKAMQESFFTWLTEKQDHAVKKMLRGKTQEEIKQGEWLKDANAKWVEEMARKFSKEYGVSFDDLHRLVLNANTWSINIPVFFPTIGQPLSDVQRDYEARTGKKFSNNPIIKDAKTQVEILDILKKKQKDVANEMETARKAGGKYWEDNKQRYKEENDALVADIHAYNALTDAEEKANKKGGKGGSKKDPLLDALKQEISLVEKLQRDYDKLSKSGASQSDALDTIRGAYGKTIRLLNAQLGKYGLPQLDISQLITGKDPNKALAHFKQTLDTLVSKGMLTLERSKELEAVVEKFTLSAKTYNLDMITKGLNNELGKLKDEYELAVELDADPEFGNAFANMMGINMDALPHTVKEYADRYTSYLNKYLKANNSNLQFANDELFGLTRDDITAFQEQVNAGTMNEAWFNEIKKAFDAISGMRKKDIEDTIKSWDKLLERYAEYEHKQTQILKKANSERVSLIKKYGTPEQASSAIRLLTSIGIEKDATVREKLISDLKALTDEVAANDSVAFKVKVAIDNEQAQESAKTAFEEFQKSPEWIVATGDLAGITEKALGTLIQSLEEYKKKARNLDPEQIKQLNRALTNLYKEQRKGNPFKTLSVYMLEAKQRAADLQPEIDETERKIKETGEQVANALRNGEKTDDLLAKMDEMQKHLENLKKLQIDLSHPDVQEWIEGLSGIAGVAKEVGEVFSGLFDGIAGHETEFSRIVKGVSTVMDKALSGASAGSAFGTYGAIVGGVLGGLGGIFSLFGDGKDSITRAMEKSELAVKRLQNSMQDLEDAAEHAYGAMESGAKRAVLANKELQLVELKRQIQLEKSRDSKDRDNSKIADLEGQYKQMLLEIKNGVEDIVNEMLGISSAGDAATQLVEVMVEAFRNGEDAMKAFSDKWDEMIDSMILKLIVSQYMQKAWDNVMKVLNQKEEEFLAASSKNKAISEVILDTFNNMSDKEKAQFFGIANWGMNKGWYWDEEKLEKLSKSHIDMWTSVLDGANAASERASEEYLKWSLDYMMGEGRDYMTQVGQNLADALGEWYTFGQDKESALSALQAGIQGITEDTAGALEAITNGISQQCYLQSDILIQIRDTVQSFDIDIQTASLSQILLQLQSSYQLQQSMLLTMENWTNPSGNAVRVELIS